MVNAATAAQEALAQAQTLWNAGSRDAAAELLREAVAIAERASPSGGSAGLIPLVRELTRMQLAEGHFAAVWDLLNRLELHLGNQADLWAIRANAAQRLGRHQDSVHAYMVALQSRPTEQRWLLGSAVSLAALGQTSSAAEMADKARAAGPISKDVQAYLRQMNVPMKD
jgi:tetratricopeptide (TPR) repeat protein